MKIGMILDNEIDDDIRVRTEIDVLISHNHEVFILCKGKEGKPQTESTKNGLFIKRFFINKKLYGLMTLLTFIFPLFHFFWYSKSLKFFKQNNIEAIHAHDLYMANVGHILAKALGIPLVIDLHENFPETVQTYAWTKKWYSKLLYPVKKWKKIELKLLLKADGIVVLSDSYRDELILRYPSLSNSSFFRFSNVPNIEYYNALDVDKTVFEKGDSFVIFYFGIIANRRGIYTLIDAVKNIVKEYGKVKLLLIGPVDTAERLIFSETAQSLIDSEVLIYYEWKDIKLLPSYIFSADVCVSPLIKNQQHESGVANKVFQYMYFEKPLIVSNCKPQAKVVQESECGLVFESENVQDLVDKITFFIENPKIKQKYGKNGRKAIENKYNTQVEGGSLNALYTKLSA